MVALQDQINYLEQFVNSARRKRLQDVLNQRTGHMRVVLENLYQAHNASAVLRSCDCFGIQHVHFIENRNSLRISDEVALGSSNWLSLHRHNEAEHNSRVCLKALKDQGFRVVVTSPHHNGTALHDFSVEQPFALVFGTELEGASEEALQAADELLRIPMYGFTESFNISVSAAICMYELSNRIRRQVNDYQLGQDEKNELYLNWLCQSTAKGELILQDFLRRHE
ncbi:MAG TPA: RNA methyltransferase [Bacteroidia bacterium]|nr:RNA methyltransferase [Bacteroidia bacterium]